MAVLLGKSDKTQQQSVQLMNSVSSLLFTGC